LSTKVQSLLYDWSSYHAS